MIRKNWVMIMALGLGLLGLASPAYADTGIPMIVVTLPGMLIALIPIIIIESVITYRQLMLPPGRSIKVTAIANIVSTAIGIPITWFLLVVLEFLIEIVASIPMIFYNLISLSNELLMNIWKTPLGKVIVMIFMSPWLGPFEKEYYWMVPAPALVLLIPFFLASWWIEYQIEKRLLKDLPFTAVKKTVRDANLASYAFLALVVLGFLIFAKPEY